MPKVPLNVRVDPDLLERLKAHAKIENRTLSNMVVTALMRYLESASPRSKEGGADNP